jgi:hypothetical protein
MNHRAKLHPAVVPVIALAQQKMLPVMIPKVGDPLANS